MNDTSSKGNVKDGKKGDAHFLAGLIVGVVIALIVCGAILYAGVASGSFDSNDESHGGHRLTRDEYIDYLADRNEQEAKSLVANIGKVTEKTVTLTDGRTVTCLTTGAGGLFCYPPETTTKEK